MKYVLFGTGDYYRRFKHWFSNREVVAILDNDINKQGTQLDGHIVLPPKDIVSYEFDAVVILSFYVVEMSNQLIQLGVKAEKVFHFYDLHDLFLREDKSVYEKNGKSVLLLSHDLSLGGPSLALYHAALVLKESGYEVIYASMVDGELRKKLEDSFIPVIVDGRLQICTMKELAWTSKFDLIICNTINYHVYLSNRDEEAPVIWWLHDSPFFYEGIRESKLENINTNNLKILSVGPVPRNAFRLRRPDVEIDDLIYGVSDEI